MDTIQNILKKQYNIRIDSCKKLNIGAGSNVFHIIADNGEQFILKNAHVNEANNPQNEPEICKHLLSKGIPVSEFLPNIYGKHIVYDKDKIYHMQKYVSGENYEMHGAPVWLMEEMPRMLGEIHTALANYAPLPMGIGENFFTFMTPLNALKSYEKSYQYALTNHLNELADDLCYRIGLMRRLDIPEINFGKLTRANTHGDFFISQIICNNMKIAAVIDWTTACVHPVVWEILRSFVYGNPNCRDGVIHIPDLVEYTKAYLSKASLNRYDLEMMPYVFYYQISVCDYYNQYFHSDADNRYIYLQQARLSTKLMKWFELHGNEISHALAGLS